MEVLGPLPLGWECKIEPKMGRLYYINHVNKSTTWEDPRLESIPTPPYHIAITQPTAYFEDIGCVSRWSSPVPSLKGFGIHRRGSSPRLGGSPRIVPTTTPPPKRQLLEVSSQPPLLLTDPNVKINISNLGDRESERPPSARSCRSSSSYCGIPSTYLASVDTETAYRTVCAIFPTAQEPHVRHLFHKYHNRATLVVSALQVEKHPLATELESLKQLALLDNDTDTANSLAETKSININSPLKMNSYVTESPARTGTPVSLLKFSNLQSSAGSLFTRYGSPQLSLSPQLQLVREERNGKPSNKSPKMKLKYMKGIFPAADETILLDVLTSVENNVQKASEKMLRKGFSRTPPSKPARHKWLEVKGLIERRQRAIEEHKNVNGTEPESPFPTPILKPARPHISVCEKTDMKTSLLNAFPALPERFVAWALEASNFDKGKTERLLKEIGPITPDEFKPFIKKKDTRKVSIGDVETLNNNIIEKMNLNHYDSIDHSEPKRGKKKSFIENLFGRKSDKGDMYSSKLAKGANSSLAKGPNTAFITERKYVETRGSCLSKGPNPSLRVGPKGSRAEGPNPSLAKGSIFARTLNGINSSFKI